MSDTARLVSYSPDGSTCTLNINGVEYYYNRISNDTERLSRENEVLREQNFEMNKSSVGLERENAELRKKLEEAEQTLTAIADNGMQIDAEGDCVNVSCNGDCAVEFYYERSPDKVDALKRAVASLVTTPESPL